MNNILSEEWECPDNLIDLAEAIDYHIDNTKVDKRKKEYYLYKERVNEMIELYNNGVGFKCFKKLN